MCAWLVPLCLLLAACSKPPPLPELSHTPTPVPLTIALHGELTVSDIRELFDAANQDGKLKNLRPFLANASDEELRILGGLVNHYLYRPAFEREGLAGLVASRVADRGFTRLEKTVASWKQTPSFVAEREFLIAALSLPEFPELLARDKAFFDADWIHLVDDAVEKAKREMGPSTEKPSAEALVADLRRLLKDEALSKPITLLAKELEKTKLGQNGVSALHELSKDNFEGLGFGLRRMLLTPIAQPGKPPKNQLEILLNLAALDSLPGNLRRDAGRNSPTRGSPVRSLFNYVPSCYEPSLRRCRRLLLSLDPFPGKKRRDPWMGGSGVSLEPMIGPETITAITSWSIAPSRRVSGICGRWSMKRREISSSATRPFSSMLSR